MQKPLQLPRGHVAVAPLTAMSGSRSLRFIDGFLPLFGAQKNHPPHHHLSSGFLNAPASSCDRSRRSKYFTAELGVSAGLRVAGLSREDELWWLTPKERIQLIPSRLDSGGGASPPALTGLVSCASSAPLVRSVPGPAEGSVRESCELQK